MHLTNFNRSKLQQNVNAKNYPKISKIIFLGQVVKSLTIIFLQYYKNENKIMSTISVSISKNVEHKTRYFLFSKTIPSFFTSKLYLFLFLYLELVIPLAYINMGKPFLSNLTFFFTTKQFSAGMYSNGKTNLQLKLPSPFSDL